MSVKYYTHFLMQEHEVPAPHHLMGELPEGATHGLSEFRGVVEVNRRMQREDFREAAKVLARNFECDIKDIKVLQWSLLH